jgi:hypothetical protein
MTKIALDGEPVKQDEAEADPLNVELHLIRHRDSFALAAAADAGDEMALTLESVIERKLGEPYSQKCVACQRTLKHCASVEAISIFLAPPESLAFAGFICARCAKASDTDLVRKLCADAPSHDATFIAHPEWRRATVH